MYKKLRRPWKESAHTERDSSGEFQEVGCDVQLMMEQTHASMMNTMKSLMAECGGAEGSTAVRQTSSGNVSIAGRETPAAAVAMARDNTNGREASLREGA